MSVGSSIAAAHPGFQGLQPSVYKFSLLAPKVNGTLHFAGQPRQFASDNPFPVANPGVPNPKFPSLKFGFKGTLSL